MAEIRGYIKKEYHGTNHTENLARGRTVETDMTGNANFPTPNPTIADLAIANDTYEQKILAADGGRGGEAAVLALNNYFPIWRGIMDNMADYVEDEAKGDTDIMESSGYLLIKQTFERKAKPDQMAAKIQGKTDHGVLYFESNNFTNSSAVITIARFQSGVENNVVISPNGDNQLDIEVNGQLVVVIHASTKHKGKLVDLTRKTEPHINMVGVNAAGFGPLSATTNDVVVP